MGYTLWPKLTKVWFAMEISVFFEALQHPTYPNLISPSGQVKLIFIYIWRKKCLTKDKVCKILPVFPVIYSERYLWQYIFLRTQEGEERSAGPKALLCVIAQHYGLLCSALYLIPYTLYCYWTLLLFTLLYVMKLLGERLPMFLICTLDTFALYMYALVETGE